MAEKQLAMCLLNLLISVCVLVVVVRCEGNSSSDLGTNPVMLNEDIGESVNRTKRNLNLLGINNPPTNPNPQSMEGLLASCQLTNLLLYQVLQQRQAQGNPFLSQLALGTGTTPNIQSAALGSILQPFPAAVNQNLIFPGATLSTYITTSTFVTKLTTTAVITIPLLFGNKPVPTTVTRTKTYDVTTSEVKTLTSTIQPTVVTPTKTVTVVPTASTTPATYDEDETSDYYANNVVDKPVVTQDFAENVQVDKQTVATPKFSAIQAKANRAKLHNFAHHAAETTSAPGKRRKNRFGSTSHTTTTSAPATSPTRRPAPRDAGNSRTTAFKYGREHYQEEYTQSQQPQSQRQQFTLKSNSYNNRQNSGYNPSSYQVEEDPSGAQYTDDYSYYARRLKRGEQYDEDVSEHRLDREYLLEPSTDGDYSTGYQNYAEKCPPIPKNQGVTVTVTHTETRTVTKLVNPSSQTSSRSFVTPSRSRSYQERGFSARARTPAPAVATTTEKPQDNNEDASSHQDRRTARYRSRGTARYNSAQNSDSQQYYGRI